MVRTPQTKSSIRPLLFSRARSPTREGKHGLHAKCASCLVLQLRKEMIDRYTGQMAMDVKIHYDNMRRVTVRENNYFYTPVDDTPFRYTHAYTHNTHSRVLAENTHAQHTHTWGRSIGESRGCHCDSSQKYANSHNTLFVQFVFWCCCFFQA